ncbi:MAG: hypothetical protein CMH31_02810 [Micavibrio sp.]|nr:hypothetical protein [Micavibrio sp.]
MKKSVFIAITIAFLTGLWLFSGLFTSDKNQTSQETLSNDDLEVGDKLVEVRVRNLTAEMMVDDITVTGRTRSSRKVDMKTEIDGQVVKILVEKGASVKKGDVLAILDVKARAARVREAEELLTQRQIQYNAAKELEEKGFNSRVRLAEARAQIELARASLKSARIELADTNIKAPFDGVINNQYIEIGDFVSKGQDIFRIVDLDPLEITGFVTEKNIMQLHVGAKTNISLTNGTEIEGELSYIASAADEKTRTFEIEISVPNEGYLLKEGLTAEITVPLEQQKAYKISPSVLALLDDGSVGVKILNENDVVQFLSITLLKDTPEYLWVSGLPDTIRLITVGQEFVIEGQAVKSISADGAGLL